MDRVNTMLDKIPDAISGSRTLTWNAIFIALYTSLIPVLIAFDWTAYVDPKTAGVIMAALTIFQNTVNVLLRFDTHGPVSR